MTAKNEIIIPDNASIVEYSALLAQANAENATQETISAIMEKIVATGTGLEKKEDERKAAEERLAKIAKIESFKPTQAKLYFRRVSEEEILKVVPDSDVFDDIEVQKIKKDATGNKRIFTTDEELKAYQALKANGVTEIIYDTEKNCIVAKPVVATAVSPEEGSTSDVTKNAEKTEVTEPEVAETAES